MLVRIINREDPDQTASGSHLGLPYLTRPFMRGSRDLSKGVQQ